jgi:hypothetical protein
MVKIGFNNQGVTKLFVVWILVMVNQFLPFAFEFNDPKIVGGMNANGPAVEGVNVGGAVRRYESRYFSQKIVPAGKPPWRNFCRPGTEFYGIYVLRGTEFSRG